MAVLDGIGVSPDRGAVRQRPEFAGADFTPTWPTSASPITASRPAPPTTTPCANASKAPPCRSSTGPRSTANGSTPSRELDAQLQGWLHRYNTRRRNHSDFMRGRIPLQVLNSHLQSSR